MWHCLLYTSRCVKRQAHTLTDNRDETYCSCLLIYHTDGRLICDDTCQCSRLGISRNCDHIQTNRAYTGHGFQLLQSKSSLVYRIDHSLIPVSYTHLVERTGTTTDEVQLAADALIAEMCIRDRAYVIQADQLGHILMEPGEECYDAVIALFGKEIIKKDKTIDRRRISDVVFTDKDMLLKLNGIIHPAVKQRILDLLGEQKEAGREICVVEAALFLSLIHI